MMWAAYWPYALLAFILALLAWRIKVEHKNHLRALEYWRAAEYEEHLRLVRVGHRNNGGPPPCSAEDQPLRKRGDMC